MLFESIEAIQVARVLRENNCNDLKSTKPSKTTSFKILSIFCLSYVLFLIESLF